MGVTGLWPILTPVKQHRTLSSLRGQTLAVDLSIWVCENQGVKQMQNRVLKPHLRNLFFRVSGLLQLGVNLIFVIEGEAPQMKWQEMSRRLQSRLKTKGQAVLESKRKYSRSHFKALLRECCELLDAMGVPYIQSSGEAEKLCAVLNQAGIVDACISDDGDCFLYGATTVYKNLTLDTKDPHVESYSMEDIHSHLRLTRERLVALALLLGCDFYPGVPGVGEARAVKLLTLLTDVNILERFIQWKKMPRDNCLDTVEAYVWQRAVALPDFPPLKVIEEFLSPKEKVPTHVPQWRRPNMNRMLVLGEKYLEWPKEYSVDKILPLITLWDMADLLRGHPLSAVHLQPTKIVKKRVRQGVPCYEVEWDNGGEGVRDEDGQMKPFITIEEQGIFEQIFPALVAEWQAVVASNPTKRKGKSKAKKDDAESLADKIEAISLDDNLTASQHALLPSSQISSVGHQPSQSHAGEKEETQSVKESDARAFATDFDSQVMCTTAEINQPSPEICSEEKAVFSGLLAAASRPLKTTFSCISSDDDDDDDDLDFVPLSQRLQRRLISSQAHSQKHHVASNNSASKVQSTSKSDCKMANSKLEPTDFAKEDKFETKVHHERSHERVCTTRSISASKMRSVSDRTLMNRELDPEESVGEENHQTTSQPERNHMTRSTSASKMSTSVGKMSVSDSEIVGDLVDPKISVAEEKIRTELQHEMETVTTRISACKFLSASDSTLSACKMDLSQLVRDQKHLAESGQTVQSYQSDEVSQSQKTKPKSNQCKAGNKNSHCSAQKSELPPAYRTSGENSQPTLSQRTRSRAQIPAHLLCDWSDEEQEEKREENEEKEEEEEREEESETSDPIHSFVSDGHFTLYHTLFDSIDCSGVSSGVNYSVTESPVFLSASGTGHSACDDVCGTGFSSDSDKCFQASCAHSDSSERNGSSPFTILEVQSETERDEFSSKCEVALETLSVSLYQEDSEDILEENVVVVSSSNSSISNLPEALLSQRAEYVTGEQNFFGSVLAYQQTLDQKHFACADREHISDKNSLCWSDFVDGLGDENVAVSSTELLLSQSAPITSSRDCLSLLYAAHKAHRDCDKTDPYSTQCDGILEGGFVDSDGSYLADAGDVNPGDNCDAHIDQDDSNSLSLSRCGDANESVDSASEFDDVSQPKSVNQSKGSKSDPSTKENWIALHCRMTAPAGSDKQECVAEGLAPVDNTAVSTLSTSQPAASASKELGRDSTVNIACGQETKTVDRVSDKRESSVFLPLSQRLKLRLKKSNVEVLNDLTNL